MDVAFGENVNLFGCVIGNGTFARLFVELRVVIGKRCKIQSHDFVCDLVTIGNCLIVRAYQWSVSWADRVIHIEEIRPPAWAMSL